MILGLGRALGEAIAVTQVIGGGDALSTGPGSRLRHAAEQDRQAATRARHASRSVLALYLAAILLVFGLVVNLVGTGDRAALRSYRRWRLDVDASCPTFACVRAADFGGAGSSTESWRPSARSRRSSPSPCS